MDVLYEKDGVTKMANERFERELRAAGWVRVEKDVPKKAGRPKRAKKDS